MRGIHSKGGGAKSHFNSCTAVLYVLDDYCRRREACALAVVTLASGVVRGREFFGTCPLCTIIY